MNIFDFRDQLIGDYACKIYTPCDQNMNQAI
jgi:hypothetical protein